MVKLIQILHIKILKKQTRLGNKTANGSGFWGEKKETWFCFCQEEKIFSQKLCFHRYPKNTSTNPRLVYSFTNVTE